VSYFYQGARKKHKARRWTEEEDGLGKELLQTGMSCTETGKTLGGRSKSAIIQRNRDLWKVDIDSHRLWTPQEENAAKQMLLKGLSYREVARSLGRTQRAVLKKNFRDWKVVNMKPRKRQHISDRAEYHRRYYDKQRFRGNRILCLTRDGFRCQDCGIVDYDDTILNVHHLNGKKISRIDHNLENLITLCYRCHSLRHRKFEKEGLKCQMRG